eukprot:jgi/Orpsp1_1/1176132/evm.model.c7180000056517.1
MFIRRAAVYVSLILCVLVTLLIMQEYVPQKLQIMINTNLSFFKYKLINFYDKICNIEKEYEISVELSKKKINNSQISRLSEYLPLQDNEYINYHEVNEKEEKDICLINHSKPIIQFTIKEKNLPLKKKILKKRTENTVLKDNFFNKYMDLKINGVDKYKSPRMERKMDGEKEYVEMNLKGKLRYVGTNFTNDVIEKPEKLYVDDITTRREGEPDKIKVTRQPSQGEGYWVKKIRIIGLNEDPEEEKKKNNLTNGNLEDVCSINEAIAIFEGSKIVTSIPCTKENDFEYCESVGYISGSVGEKITWYYAEVIDSDVKYANPKAHELSLELCKQKSNNPENCTIWGSMLNGCGVIASSPTGTFSVGYAMNFMKAVNANLNKVFATQKAMDSCEKNDSSKGLCHVSWVRCTATSHREPRRFI